MAEEIRRDLRMIGETSSNGGQFRHVRIVGESVLSSDVDCLKLHCTGELDINGDLKVGGLRLTGECEVKGNLDATKIGGRGEISILAGARLEEVKFTGNIDVKGDCEVGSYRGSGAFTVGGLLSAEILEITMYGPCNAKELGGGTLKIKRSRSAIFSNLIRSKHATVLNTELIEGDSIDIEHTVANVVRGNRVKVGAGCDIDRVEYRGTLQIHKSAIVREQIKL
ncbi:hypothetical protein [Cohnella abietis]|uniref:Cell shape determination protein CcmA n=1 Tax=Cohnella abietis TaxID=2507935 RepID=A0A3T1DAP3_9BACL|nr:hypothetical protein [Cohnella abietis]BBI35172.1 hypothetical protein KCTCHS21_45710 [Cohnella abietis]